jgi:hypothetical protein
MVSRGALVGVLVCGSKHDGEVYAPDEFEALEAVTHGVGAALDTMRRSSTDVLAAMHEDIISRLDILLAELRTAKGKDLSS